MAKKKFQLSFSPDLVNVPITYRMVKDYAERFYMPAASATSTETGILG